MPEMEQPENVPTRITVDGTPYVIPPLDTFDLDEAMVMYKYSELTFDQIFELEGLHPGVIAGLLHVSIQRSDPALREKEVREQVKRINMMNVMEQLAELVDQQPDPTKDGAQQLELDSNRSSSEATSSSGDDSESSSEHSPEKSSPDSSGSPDSDTSSISDPTTLAASQRIS
jgi:hypothetical protein